MPLTLKSGPRPLLRLVMGVLGGALLACLPGCPGAQACALSGLGALRIDGDRAALISDITVDGQCQVTAPSMSCDAGGCEYAADGGLTYVYRVKGLAVGKCEVVVTFSDGAAAPLVGTFNFLAGPIKYCCEPICEQSGGIALEFL